MSNQVQWQGAGSAAETYERALVPAVFAAWAPLVVALADPRPGERVLAPDTTAAAGYDGDFAVKQSHGALLLLSSKIEDAHQ